MTPFANNPEFTERVQGWVREISRRTCYHTLELPGGQIVPGTIPVEALRARLDRLEIPASFAGKRVLDVGAASGWNSFELERRGAEVVAVDCVEYPELPLAKAALESRVDYRILDVEELTPASVGLFDCVLFLGVLYHLRHPLLGLERICAITRETAFVESYVTDSAEAPSGSCNLEFYELDELGGQLDNWFGPTTQCLLALCRSAGFARVDLIYSAGGRAAVRCSRIWEPPAGEPSSAPPRMIAAVNNRSNDNQFHPNRDEYICVYFRSTDSITRQTVRVEVDGYGAPALAVSESRPGEWQANVRVPPLLAPGMHKVRLRTTLSGFSNEAPIEMAPGLEALTAEPFQASDAAGVPAPEIFLLENSDSRERVFHGYRSERIMCQMRTAERSLDRRRVLIQLNERVLEIENVIELGNRGWQINAKLPVDLEAGSHELRVRTAGSSFSEPETIVFDPLIS